MVGNGLRRFDMDKKTQAIYLGARLLDIPADFAEKNSHVIDGMDAVYICVPEMGGAAIIVSYTGEVLYAMSCIGYDEHVSEFSKGRRTPLDAFDG